MYTLIHHVFLSYGWANSIIILGNVALLWFVFLAMNQGSVKATWPLQNLPSRLIVITQILWHNKTIGVVLYLSYITQIHWHNQDICFNCNFFLAPISSSWNNFKRWTITSNHGWQNHQNKYFVDNSTRFRKAKELWNEEAVQWKEKKKHSLPCKNKRDS